MVVTPSKSFLYASSIGFSGIVGYRLVGPGLQLQNLFGGFTFRSAYPINSITMHPSGNFLYAIESDAHGHIQQFSIDPDTGLFKGGFSVLTESSYSGFSEGVIDPTGQFFFVGDGYGRIFVYQIDPSTGALSTVNGSPFAVPSGDQPTHLALDGTGSFLYATLYKGGLAAFAINKSTGALTNVAGSPFPASHDTSTPAYMAINTATNTIYISNFPDSNITEFSIDPVTGVPSTLSGSPVAVPGSVSGDALTSLVIDPDAGVLFAATSAQNKNIDAMRIDPRTGALSALPGAPFTGTAYTTDIIHLSIP